MACQASLKERLFSIWEDFANAINGMTTVGTVSGLKSTAELLQLLGMEVGMKPMPSGSASSAASWIRTAMPYDIVAERF